MQGGEDAGRRRCSEKIPVPFVLCYTEYCCARAQKSRTWLSGCMGIRTYIYTYTYILVHWFT